MQLRAVGIAALAVVLATACAHRPAIVVEVEREGLQQRQSSFLSALSAKDVEQTTAHFAEDAVIHVANMPPLQGRSAIRQFYGNVFRFLSASAATSEMMRVSSRADMAYSVGRVTNVFEGEQGPAEYTGKYLLVWEKREGEWLIAIYSISNNRPEANR